MAFSQKVMKVLKNPLFAYALVVVLAVVIATGSAGKKKCDCPVCENTTCDCEIKKKVSFSDSVEMIDTTQGVGPAGVEGFQRRRR